MTFYYSDEVTKVLGNNLDGYSFSTQLDEKLTKAALATCEEVLSMYDEELFLRIEDECNQKIIVYLVDDIRDNNQFLDGRTQIKNHRIDILIDADSDVKEVLSHELIHVFDSVITMKGNSDELLELWKKNNPEGFVYDLSNDIDSRQDYSKYFFSSYGMSAYNEDMATIMGNLYRSDEYNEFYSSSYVKAKVSAFKEIFKKSLGIDISIHS